MQLPAYNRLQRSTLEANRQESDIANRFMLITDVISKKRDGGELSAAEIEFAVSAFSRGEVADYQMSALAMAICIRGMTVDETVELTRQMLASGRTLNWQSSVPAKVDKHSTGGLGDKVSIVLAPLLAAVGLQVPMISGRGLGITGGTLDKLESIPGFRTQLSMDEIQAQTESIGCVICGASEELAPADRRLYALRDVTATIESVPLITASILSKKLAESISSLVLDVKFGSGAFMATTEQAKTLAKSLVRVGNRLGVKTKALITNMNQPLGRMVGNTVEIFESIDVLEGQGPPDVRQLTIELGCELLLTEGVVDDREQARLQLQEALDSGAALDRFHAMVAAQGGTLPSVGKANSTAVVAERAGWVNQIQGRQLGGQLVEMGGGRRLASDQIDPSVGLELLVRLGDEVCVGQPLLRVFSPREVGTTRTAMMREAFLIEEHRAAPQPLILAEETDFAEDEES